MVATRYVAALVNAHCTPWLFARSTTQRQQRQCDRDHRRPGERQLPRDLRAASVHARESQGHVDAPGDPVKQKIEPVAIVVEQRAVQHRESSDHARGHEHRGDEHPHAVPGPSPATRTRAPGPRAASGNRGSAPARPSAPPHAKRCDDEHIRQRDQRQFKNQPRRQAARAQPVRTARTRSPARPRARRTGDRRTGRSARSRSTPARSADCRRMARPDSASRRWRKSSRTMQPKNQRRRGKTRAEHLELVRASPKAPGDHQSSRGGNEREARVQPRHHGEQEPAIITCQRRISSPATCSRTMQQDRSNDGSADRVGKDREAVEEDLRQARSAIRTSSTQALLA